MEYPKRIERQFREVASLAHENELARELEELARSFDEWRQGKISAGELTERVHKYHNGPARELWKMYNALEAQLLVARAVVQGIIQRQDVPEDVWPYVEEAIERYRLVLRKDEASQSG